MLSHARAVTAAPSRDGDLDAVVVRVAKTGGSGTVEGDRYKHAIAHSLGRVPVGCQIIMADRACDVYTVAKDANRIIVRFSTSDADVNLRIW